MNDYQVNGDVILGDGGYVTVRTLSGHHVFITHGEDGVFAVHIESEDHGGSSEKSLATVTDTGWEVSHG